MMTTAFKNYSATLMSLLVLVACSNAEFSSDNKIRKRAALQADSNPAISQDFSTGGYASTEHFEFSASNSLVAKDVKLENSYSDQSREFTQIDRPMLTKLHKQGAAGTAITEAFNQGTSGVVDILVVIDNSGSMAEEQLNLSTKLGPLLQEIANTDWQISVITTDAANECSRALISKGQANAAALFSTAISAGVSGSGDEEGIYRARQGLECTIMGKSWLRPNSSLAVLWVTDEDNCSDGSTCPAARAFAADPNYVKLSTVFNGRVIGTNARFYGIYRIPGDATCTTAPAAGADYHQLVTGSNGAFGSICANDYTPTLQAISKNIASTLKAQFTLKDTPDAGSLVVKVNDVQKTAGFTVTGTTLTFTDVPPANAKIDVTYTSGRQPQLKEFAIDEKPAAGTLSVLVNMVEVKAGFKVEANPDRIVFEAEPAPSADIRVMFRRDMPLLRDFAMPGINPVGGSMKVFVSDVETKDFTYDAAAKSIRLGSAPIDLAKIKASFKNLNGPVLTYPFTVTDPTIQDLRAIDKDTKSPIRITYKDGNLDVNQDDHKEGRVVTVTYKTVDSYKSQIRLARTPVLGSVVLDASPADCTIDQGISVVGDVLEVNCSIDDLADFSGSYQYDLELQTSFTLQNVRNPEEGSWVVLVEGALRTDYVREGKTITFDAAALPRRGTVTVTFTPGGK